MFNNQIIAGSSGQGGGSFYSETIDNSVRIVGNSTGSNAGRFTRTFSTVDSATDFTLNFWVKRNEQDNPVNSSYGQNIFNFRSGTSGSVLNDIAFAGNTYTAGDQILITDTNSANPILATSNLLRDFGAWYNIHIMADMNNATASERLKIFINGTEASYAVDNRSSYSTFAGLAAGAWTIGDYYGYNYSIGSTIARWAFVDNSTLAASYFGEFSNGIWVPKALTGITWGSAGHLLDFAGTGTSQDSSGIGADTSGQNNHWAVSNIAATDILIDTPSNNFCTLNPLTHGTYPTLKEGNLSIASVYSSDLSGVASTWYPTTGKWYWEVHNENAASTYPYLGITEQSYTNWNATKGSYYGVAWLRTGTSASSTNYMGTITKNNVTSWTNNDIIMFALDVDNRKLWVGKNGTWDGSGDPAAGTGEDASWTDDTGVSPMLMGYSGQGVDCVFNFGQDGTFNGNQTAQGNADGNGVGDFYYSPPTGFLAMATSNIAEPTIGPNSDTQATDHFETKLWSSDVVNPAAGDKQISLNFQPDLVWSKNRDNAENHYWMDSVRGDNVGNKWLRSNSTAAEGADAVSSTTAKYDFTSTGFDIIDTNSASGEVYYNNGSASSPRTYVGWCWKAGGTATSNTDGSITSSVSANTDAGFSIVSFTTDGVTSGTVGHGLGVQPQLIIGKTRNHGVGWYVQTPLQAANLSGQLDTTTAWYNPGYNHWNDTHPTSTVFSVGGYMADHADLTNPSTKIAYCFANVEGYSKVGLYKGNFNANGPFIYTGFRPAWILLKRTDSADSWLMRDNKRDTYNVTAQMINANASTAEYTDSTLIDFLSNGFKLRHQNSLMNASGGTFIYLAFAEAPFKYANAK